jgi:hypothetical protein
MQILKPACVCTYPKLGVFLHVPAERVSSACASRAYLACVVCMCRELSVYLDPVSCVES